MLITNTILSMKYSYKLLNLILYIVVNTYLKLINHRPILKLLDLILLQIIKLNFTRSGKYTLKKT